MFIKLKMALRQDYVNGVNYALSQGYTTVFAEDVAAPLANSAIYGTPVVSYERRWCS